MDINYILSAIEYNVEKNNKEELNTYFDMLYNSDDIKQVNKNLFLILLSSITEISDYYKDKAINLSLVDVGCTDDSPESELRKLIYRQSFTSAMLKLNDVNIKYKDSISFLIKFAIDHQRIINDEIISLIRQRKYEEVKKIINSKNLPLSKSDNLVMTEIEKIDEIKTKGKILEPEDMTEHKFYEAIKTNNFSTALKMNEDYNLKHDYDGYKSSSCLLINDIIIEMNKIHPLNRDDALYVSEKYKELLDEGIILLEPMDDEQIIKIHNIISNYLDVFSFTINNDGKKQIVMKLLNKEYIDYNETKENAKIQYIKGNYLESVEENKKMLLRQNASIGLYFQTGLVYFRIGKLSKSDKYLNIAKTYLTITKSLAKEIDYELNKDVEDIINEINKRINANNNEIDSKDNGDYYFLTDMNIINELAENLSFDEICKKLELNQEEISLLALIYAKECYSYNNISSGNAYLKRAVNSKNKTKELKKEIKKVMDNKKFYSNRLPENHKKLNLARLNK